MPTVVMPDRFDKVAAKMFNTTKFRVGVFTDLDVAAFLREHFGGDRDEIKRLRDISGEPGETQTLEFDADNPKRLKARCVALTAEIKRLQEQFARLIGTDYEERVADLLKQASIAEAENTRLRAEVKKWQEENGWLGESLADAQIEIEGLKGENAELNHLFDVQWKRMGEATEWWRKRTGQCDVSPDLGELLRVMLAAVPKEGGG